MGGQKVHVFNGNRWYSEMIIKRTKAALEIREREFVERHVEDSDEELLLYLRDCAEELGYSPFSSEVIGHTLITARFGNWGAALGKAQLPNAVGKPPSPTKRLIFRQELEVQRKLYRAERDALKLQRQHARARKSQ